MQGFTPDQWMVLLLSFLLGLFLGMAFLSNPKWKRRYREEARLRSEETRRREALEAERTTWEADRAKLDDSDAERAREQERLAEEQRIRDEEGERVANLREDERLRELQIREDERMREAARQRGEEPPPITP